MQIAILQAVLIKDEKLQVTKNFTSFAPERNIELMNAKS